MRSYEIYQRERVGETTNLVTARHLLTDDYLRDPFSVPGIMREHYPCYRDWIGNRFWVTRYDDVTSVFVDDANFETRRPSGLDFDVIGLVEGTWVGLHDAGLEMTLARALDGAAHDGSPFDLVGVVDRFAASMMTTVLGLDRETGHELVRLLHVAKRGTGWDERDRVAGGRARAELVALIEPELEERRARPAGDLLTALVDVDVAAETVVCGLIDADLATLPAAVANLWCLLLGDLDQFAQVVAEPRLMKFAYLETLRHSPPIVTADRFTRHEVERFGRLLPEGALVHLSAAAANRDPRQFEDPDRFDVTRKDLCQREPRGQYRADGLPSGIAFGLGKPSTLPAVPRDEPRSRYALTRDVAVAFSLGVLERWPALRLVAGAEPVIGLDRLGGTYRCRSLAVEV